MPSPRRRTRPCAWRGSSLEVVDAAGEKRPGWTTVTFDGGFVQLPPGLFDVAAERDRLAKQRADVEATLERSARKLANEGFTAKAAPDVVAQERAKHDRLATQTRRDRRPARRAGLRRAAMRYEDALAELDARRETRMIPDLSRIMRLATLMDDPQLAYPTIHVTGTNGKGTAANGGGRTRLCARPHRRPLHLAAPPRGHRAALRVRPGHDARGVR